MTRSRRSAASFVEREHGEHDVDRDERAAFERNRLAVARDLPHGDRHHCQRTDVDGREDERQAILEEEREQDERGEEERRDLRNGVLDHRDGEIGLPLRRERDPDEFSTAFPAIPTMTSPVNAFEMPSASTAGSSASTNHSDTNAAPTPATTSTAIAVRNANGVWLPASRAGSFASE